MPSFPLTVAGVVYTLRQTVLADDEPLCDLADWPEVVRARIASLEAEAAELRAALGEAPALESSAAEPASVGHVCAVCGFVANTAAGLAGHARRHAPSDAPSEPEGRYPCPQCDFAARTARGLGLHVARRHKSAAPAPALASEPTPAPTPAPAEVAEDAAAWRCAQCGSDAFAADVRRPGLCIRCAGAAVRGRSVAGVVEGQDAVAALVAAAMAAMAA